jgi:hypothetical protein
MIALANQPRMDDARGRRQTPVQNKWQAQSGDAL